MSESVGQAVVAALAPEAVKVIQAFQAFDTAMGNDPSKWLVNYVPAKLQFLATVTGQVVPAEVAAIGAVNGALMSALSGVVAKLQAKA